MLPLLHKKIPFHSSRVKFAREFRGTNCTRKPHRVLLKQKKEFAASTERTVVEFFEGLEVVERTPTGGDSESSQPKQGKVVKVDAIRADASGVAVPEKIHVQFEGRPVWHAYTLEEARLQLQHKEPNGAEKVAEFFVAKEDDKKKRASKETEPPTLINSDVREYRFPTLEHLRSWG